jgi:hypothetical protein
MKAIALILLLACVQWRCHCAETNIVATGEWSEPVGGLRARLLVSTNLDGTLRRVRVYVELQNVLDRINPMEIYVGENGPLTCQLLDDAGKPPAPALSFGSGPVIPPYWLVLPVDSSLKLRADTLIAWAVGESGLSLAVGRGCWFIPDNSLSDYSLSGTFSAPTPQEANEHPRAWSGVLKLPAVRIPTPRKKP